MKKISYKIAPLLLLLLFVTGCVEPYALETKNFESALVIEATITNELKNQEIKLSKTYKFEEDGPTFETGAQVYLVDDQGNNYDFAEQEGSYISTTPFQAVNGRSYTLNILLADGKNYRSTPQTLTTATPIESLNATVTTDPNGQRGVAINVNSQDPSGTSKYYRYEYEETYKIIAPYWNPNDLTYNAMQDQFYEVPRPEETKTCFSTKNSNSIIITTTNDQVQDQVNNFTVRFLNDQDPIIANRYSILVKQYVQNLESYTFYNTLKTLSGSGSLLSQNQPGFFYGNVRSVENPSEKVIGFFDVSSVSETRLFFNYVDLFPGEPLPPYFDQCELLTYDISVPAVFPGLSPKQILVKLIEANSVRFYERNLPIYTMVLPICGDCTSFSSNLIPSFWED